MNRFIPSQSRGSCPSEPLLPKFVAPRVESSDLFGVLGANFAAVLRALVACGWFGIQTWIGGEAINTLITTLAPGWAQVSHGAAICFMAFWLINLGVIDNVCLVHRDGNHKWQYEVPLKD